MKSVKQIFSNKEMCLKLRQWSKRFVLIAILLTVVGFIGTVQGYSSCDANDVCSEQLLITATYEGSLTLGGVFLILGIVILAIGIVGYVVFFLKSR